MPNSWKPDSWKSRQASQQPKYDDDVELQEVLAALRRLPPLVTSWEVDRLQTQLAEFHGGNGWILQGGDCAESFDDCQSESIASKLKVLLQMSLVLIFGSGQRILRIGRIAGQYAKPRSSDVEARDGASLPSYRGDLINRAAYTIAAARLRALGVDVELYPRFKRRRICRPASSRELETEFCSGQPRMQTLPRVGQVDGGCASVF